MKNRSSSESSPFAEKKPEWNKCVVKKQSCDEGRAIIAIHLSDYISAALRISGSQPFTRVDFGEESTGSKYQLRACLCVKTCPGGKQQCLFGAEAEKEICDLVQSETDTDCDFSFDYLENIYPLSGNGKYMSEEAGYVVKKMLCHVVAVALRELQKNAKNVPLGVVQIWCPPHISFSYSFRKQMEQALMDLSLKCELVFYSDEDIYLYQGRKLQPKATAVLVSEWNSDALRVFCFNQKKKETQIVVFPELGTRSLVGCLWKYLRKNDEREKPRFYGYDMRNVLAVEKTLRKTEPCPEQCEMALYGSPLKSELDAPIPVTWNQLRSFISKSLKADANFKAHCEEVEKILRDYHTASGTSEDTFRWEMLHPIDRLKSVIHSLKDVQIFFSGSAMMIPGIVDAVKELVGPERESQELIVKNPLKNAFKIRGASGSSRDENRGGENYAWKTAGASGDLQNQNKQETDGDRAEKQPDETHEEQSLYEKAMNLLESQQEALALHYLNTAVNQFDDLKAKEVLGIILTNGEWKGRKITDAAPEKGMKYLRELQAPSPEAWNVLGLNYFYGRGVEKDDVIAFDCFLKAAEGGNARGKYNVSISYEFGEGVKTNPQKALDWLMKAARDDNYCRAQYRLGARYAEGKLGLQKDQQEAIAWYTKAADQGYPLAQLQLGYCYKDGVGVPPSAAAAEIWGYKVAENEEATSDEKADAYYLLGQLYEERVEKAEDEQHDKGAKAIACYEKSAQLGGVAAKGWLGYCYCEGILVEKDLAKGIDLYREAAAQGNVLSLNNLAIFYEMGCSPYVPMDIEKALSYYAKAAETGEVAAENNYTRLRKKEYDNERKKLKEDAASGEVTPQKNYAYACAGLYGVKEREWLDPSLFISAAEAGHIPSLLLLSRCYMIKSEGEDDVKKAMSYLEKAMALRKSTADTTLPACYMRSLDGVLNLPQADMWFCAAAVMRAVDFDEKNLPTSDDLMRIIASLL